jgi:hypothetical protein
MNTPDRQKKPRSTKKMERLITRTTQQAWNGLYCVADDEYGVTEVLGSLWGMTKGGERDREPDRAEMCFISTKWCARKTKISERNALILALKRTQSSALFCGTYGRRPH